jgi:hypothetical protein
VQVVASRDVSQYRVGEAVDFPLSRDKVKGFLMKIVSDDDDDEDLQEGDNNRTRSFSRLLDDDEEEEQEEEEQPPPWARVKETEAGADLRGKKTPGKLYVRSTPPEAWEGGSWEGECDKNMVAKAWPAGIVCENLLDHCVELGSQDNLSAVLLLLSESQATAGFSSHDGSTLDTIQAGHGMVRSSREAEVWRRRRNSSQQDTRDAKIMSSLDDMLK